MLCDLPLLCVPLPDCSVLLLFASIYSIYFSLSNVFYHTLPMWVCVCLRWGGLRRIRCCDTLCTPLRQYVMVVVLLKPPKNCCTAENTSNCFILLLLILYVLLQTTSPSISLLFFAAFCVSKGYVFITHSPNARVSFLSAMLKAVPCSFLEIVTEGFLLDTAVERRLFLNNIHSLHHRGPRL